MSTSFVLLLTEHHIQWIQRYDWTILEYKYDTHIRKLLDREAWWTTCIAHYHWTLLGGRRGRGRMVLGFTTIMYLCNQCLSSLTLWVWTPLSRGVLDTKLCDKIVGDLTGWWFSAGTLVSSTNKSDCHNITEILLKVCVKHHKPNQCC